MGVIHGVLADAGSAPLIRGGIQLQASVAWHLPRPLTRGSIRCFWSGHLMLDVHVALGQFVEDRLRLAGQFGRDRADTVCLSAKDHQCTDRQWNSDVPGVRSQTGPFRHAAV